MSKHLEINGSSEPLTDEIIYLVSPCRAQNELMASFIKEKTGAKCLTIENIHALKPIDSTQIEPPRLILLDCMDKDPESVFVKLASIDNRLLSRDVVVLLNVSPGHRIEDEATMQGVRGFFYTNDSLDKFLKGIRALLQGELWISREIMQRMLQEVQIPFRRFKLAESPLTRREMEILIMVSSGIRNVEIADALYISTHTVKSHLYNIYKKIDVSNRFEAGLWVKENLLGPIKQ